MTRLETIANILELLREKIDDAEAEAQDSHNEAPNSYGDGYDRGYTDALRELLTQITSDGP